MKAAFLTAAAALMGSAMAADHHHHHDHAALHRRVDAVESPATCGCYTSVVTYWGAPTLVPVSAAAPSTSTTTTTVQSTRYSTVTVQPSSSSPAPAPSSSTSPLPVDTVTVFPTPGTYTIPATSVTVSSSTVVAQPTTTSLASGTHTIGGVTTVVETETVVTCPYATQTTSGSSVSNVIKTTTYTCPSAGTYTIAPLTTSLSTSSVIVYPTPASVTPGTYSRSQQVVTVVETSFTYWCPFADSTSTSSTSVAVSTSPAPAPASATSVVASVSSVASSSSASASSTGAATGTGNSLGKVDQYAVTYTGYTHDTGACMSADEVKSELENIQANGFYAIRMYSTDCNQMETVATQAVALGLRVILGIYIDSSGTSSGSSQVTDVVNWGKSNNWNGVEFIVLDNEAVSDGYCTASELASFVTSAKSTITAAGYTGQFTVSEPLDIWQSEGSTLCDVIDFASANLQPFFNSDVVASDAGSFVESEVNILKTICSQSETVFVGEAGWPTSGSSNGKAVPGTAEQKAAVDSIRSAVGSFTAQFSYKNDNWKSPGSYGVEQYWGVYDLLSDSE